jgi:diguanylate cyclase (GGDEF)-like protein/PAS domain S-box-containing protein
MANPLAVQILIPIARTPIIVNLFDLLDGYAPEIRNLIDGFDKPRGIICENNRVYVGLGAAKKGAKDPLVLACTIIKIDEAKYMSVITDISRQVVQERRLKETESWFAAILSGVNDFALLSLDDKGRIDSWNQSGVRQTGYGNEVIGQMLDLFLCPDDKSQTGALEQIELARRDGWHLDEGWRQRKDGSRYWCQSLVSALEEESEEITGFSVVLRDVTERKVSGEELRRLLTTDYLTGAANRARFFELAEAEEARWLRLNRPLSALMLDADHFKQINDTFGHAAGDAVLKALAKACQEQLRTIDTLARLGGEEFVILLPSTEIEGALQVAERLRSMVQNLRVETDDGDISFTVSIGCAEMGGELDSINKLLRAADEALYEAKQEGRNRANRYQPRHAVA